MFVYGMRSSSLQAPEISSTVFHLIDSHT